MPASQKNYGNFKEFESVNIGEKIVDLEKELVFLWLLETAVSPMSKFKNLSELFLSPTLRKREPTAIIR